MKIIDAANLDYRAVNEALRGTDNDCTIEGCCGQRFIAAGMSDRNLTINGIPGNALGAYLNNANITVNANAQDAVGDTMNEGKILIHGNIGDAAGYAMRGGKIYVQGNAGYRAGIHMKDSSHDHRWVCRKLSWGISGWRRNYRPWTSHRRQTYRRQFPMYRNARR